MNSITQDTLRLLAEDLMAKVNTIFVKACPDARMDTPDLKYKGQVLARIWRMKSDTCDIVFTCEVRENGMCVMLGSLDIFPDKRYPHHEQSITSSRDCLDWRYVLEDARFFAERYVEWTN